MNPTATILPPADRLTVVAGPGGVGKTTLAAALGASAAAAGHATLVMTFDPSLRLRQALGLGDSLEHGVVPVPGGPGGRLHAALLDARATFDGLIRRHTADEAARRRILENRFYKDLAGSLAGVLEYMAVERLLEVAEEGWYDRIVLDTPPARNALDLLDAPRRVVSFLDSGAVRLALKPWFDESGRLRPAARLGPLGRRAETLLDRVVGLDLLRDMAEFFQAFAPLYAGFRERAERVAGLLTSGETGFLLVTTPRPERVGATLFFARALVERGHSLRGVLANQVAGFGEISGARRGALCRVLSYLGETQRRGLAALEDLLGEGTPLWGAPLMADPPIGPDALLRLAERIAPAPAP